MMINVFQFMNVDDRARLHEKKKKIEGKQKNQIKR